MCRYFCSLYYCMYCIYNVFSSDNVHIHQSRTLKPAALSTQPSSTSLLFSPSSTKTTESIQKLAVNADHTLNHQHGIAKIPGNHYSRHLLAPDGCLFICIRLLVNGSSDHNLVIFVCYKRLVMVHQDYSLSDPV